MRKIINLANDYFLSAFVLGLWLVLLSIPHWVGV
jgi:hypothetical protein